MEKQNLSPREAYELLVNVIRTIVNNNITVQVDKSLLFYKDSAIEVYNYLLVNDYCFRNTGEKLLIEKNKKLIAELPCIYNFLDSLIELIPKEQRKWRSQV